MPEVTPLASQGVRIHTQVEQPHYTLPSSTQQSDTEEAELLLVKRGRHSLYRTITVRPTHFLTLLPRTTSLHLGAAIIFLDPITIE